MAARYGHGKSKLAVPRSFLTAAHEVLTRRGSALEIRTLVKGALAMSGARARERGPRGKSPRSRLAKAVREQRIKLLAQELYRLARAGQGGFTVDEYPGFRLRKLQPPPNFPDRGHVAAAFKLLAAEKGYADVRSLTRRALKTGLLQTISGVPEYWMYEALLSHPMVFSRRGWLTIGTTRRANAASLHTSPSGTVVEKSAAHETGMTEGISEENLERLIVENLNQVESGLRLIKRQYTVPVGRIDLLCEDRKGRLVVIEIKRHDAKTEELIGQIARYMGYVDKHLAKRGQNVRGIVVVGRPDQRLAYAAQAIPNLEIKKFQVTLSPFRPGEFT